MSCCSTASEWIASSPNLYVCVSLSLFFSPPSSLTEGPCVICHCLSSGYKENLRLLREWKMEEAIFLFFFFLFSFLRYSRIKYPLFKCTTDTHLIQWCIWFSLLHSQVICFSFSYFQLGPFLSVCMCVWKERERKRKRERQEKEKEKLSTCKVKEGQVHSIFWWEQFFSFYGRIIGWKFFKKLLSLMYTLNSLLRLEYSRNGWNRASIEKRELKRERELESEVRFSSALVLLPQP